MILAETVREILRILHMLNFQRNAVYRWNAFFEKRTERCFRLVPGLLVKSVRGSSATSILVISLVNRRTNEEEERFLYRFESRSLNWFEKKCDNERVKFANFPHEIKESLKNSPSDFL